MTDTRTSTGARPPAPGSRVAAAATVDWEPEVAVEAVAAPVAWDGTCTTLKAGVPIMRNHRVLGEGTDFVVRAVQLGPGGRWVGPEAEHVERLFQIGAIQGSRAWKERMSRTAATEFARGVHQPLEMDENGKVVQRPMVELAARTGEQVQREWERPLAMHITDDAKRQRELLRRERQDARGGESTADELATAIGKALGGRGVYPGAEGPGTAQVDG